MSKIAFFGLGAMGEPMAEQLLKAGHQLTTAVHRNRAPAERLVGFGLKILDTPAQAAADADYVITMLPDDPEVKAFLINESFASALKPGCCIIDMTSCTTEAIQAVEAFYKPRGIYVVDAPVSGGVRGAKAGTLTIFGSGEPKALSLAKPLFEIMGKEDAIYDLGKCGTGKAFKNLNNMLYLINLSAVAEARRIAVENGLDLTMLREVISKSSGNSACVNFFDRPEVVNRTYQPAGFSHGLARKDVGNAIKLAKRSPTPIAHLVYDMMLGNGVHDKDSVLAIREMMDPGIE